MEDGSKYDFMKDTPSDVEEIEEIMNSVGKYVNI
jgi:hypothetical protein